MPTRASFLPPVLQATAGASALALLAWAPPSQGRMTIVSLTGQSADQLAAWSLDGGLSVVAVGDHSLTVEGARAALIWRAAQHGAVVLAARSAECAEGESNI